MEKIKKYPDIENTEDLQFEISIQVRHKKLGNVSMGYNFYETKHEPVTEGEFMFIAKHLSFSCIRTLQKGGLNND